MSKNDTLRARLTRLLGEFVERKVNHSANEAFRKHFVRYVEFENSLDHFVFQTKNPVDSKWVELKEFIPGDVVVKKGALDFVKQNPEEKVTGYLINKIFYGENRQIVYLTELTSFDPATYSWNLANVYENEIISMEMADFLKEFESINPMVEITEVSNGTAIYKCPYCNSENSLSYDFVMRCSNYLLDHIQVGCSRGNHQYAPLNLKLPFFPGLRKVS